MKVIIKRIARYLSWLQYIIKVTKILHEEYNDDVLEIFFKMNSKKRRMHNMESTYESLLILYMLKNRFFEND